jgi:hypothetical protein
LEKNPPKNVSASSSELVRVFRSIDIALIHEKFYECSANWRDWGTLAVVMDTWQSHQSYRLSDAIAGGSNNWLIASAITLRVTALPPCNARSP